MASKLSRLWIGVCAGVSLVLSAVPPCSSQEAKPRIAENQLPDAPDGRDVLQKLAQFDSIFKSGFRASGTMSYLDSAELTGGEPYYKVRAKWRLTFESDRVAYDINVTDYETSKYLPPDQRHSAHNPLVPSWPRDKGMPVTVRLREWGYWGEEASGQHYVDACVEIAPNGKATRLGTMYNSAVSSPRSISWVGALHSFQWSLGRFFSERLDKITSVEKAPDGRLRVSALGSEYKGSNARWELEIEPSAAWMVRRARFYGRSGRIRAEMVNEGTIWSGPFCIPERARINPYGPIVNIDNEVPNTNTGSQTKCLEFQTAAGGFDEDLYKQAEQALLHCKEEKFTMTDERVSPTITTQPNTLARKPVAMEPPPASRKWVVAANVFAILVLITVFVLRRRWRRRVA